MDTTSPGTSAETDRAAPRIGISACLLGKPVRTNGGHCRQAWITDVLAKEAEFVVVCPEVEVGLPTPRPVMRLARTEAADGALRFIVTDSGEDLTDRMTAYAHAKMDALAGEDLHGFILKKDSPSCGVFRVKHYDRNGSPSERGPGLFGGILSARFPNLPIEEEGRLNDRDLRESFLVRVFAYQRWKAFLREDGTAGGLVAFHARYKMALLASAPEAYRDLGRIVAQGGGEGFAERLDTYETHFMAALAQRSSRGRHINVMQHLLGFAKDGMSASDKAELAEVLQRYREGAVPRAAPLTLVRFLLQTHNAPVWALEQYYLEHYTPQLVQNEAM